jgi:hypothetical protein
MFIFGDDLIVIEKCYDGIHVNLVVIYLLILLDPLLKQWCKKIEIILGVNRTNTTSLIVMFFF